MVDGTCILAAQLRILLAWCLSTRDSGNGPAKTWQQPLSTVTEVKLPVAKNGFVCRFGVHL